MFVRIMPYKIADIVIAFSTDFGIGLQMLCQWHGSKMGRVRGTNFTGQHISTSF